MATPSLDATVSVRSSRQGALRARGSWIPRARYTSREFLDLELEHLWPRVWQVACREEELARVGDHLEYEIADQSLVVLRAAGGYRAFHNSCPHRARRLVEGRGRTQHIRCPFHAWRFDLDGHVDHIPDRDDFDGLFRDEDVALRRVAVDTWGGFVFVNLDPDAEPLATFLAPIPDMLDPFRLTEMRFTSCTTVMLPCNWKVATDADTESYHIQGTHPQSLAWVDDTIVSTVHGPHGSVRFGPGAKGFGTPSPRLNWPANRPIDRRANLIKLMSEDNRLFGGRELFDRLMTELPADADGPTVLGTFVRWKQEAAREQGIEWPEIPPEHLLKAGLGWWCFPNLSLQVTVDSATATRARPMADDPHSCRYDLWTLQRAAPGRDPAVERRALTDWRDGEWGKAQVQDLSNMEAMQRGMRSRAYESVVVSPRQESIISNYHAAIDTYLFG